MKRCLQVMTCALTLTVFSVVPAEAVNHVVDSSDGAGTPTDCQSPSTTNTHTTINAALFAANDGDTIFICRGSGPYNEQLTVNKNVTLVGRRDATLAPSPMVGNADNVDGGTNNIAAVIAVIDNKVVHIDKLTIDASGNSISTCDPRVVGVYYRNADGSVTNNVVKGAHGDFATGVCQNGMGLFIQSSGGGLDSNVTARNNSVYGFERNGITGNYVGTVLTAVDNRVQGQPNDATAQNGIQLGFGGRGSVSTNILFDLIFTGASPSNLQASAGILIFDPANANPATNVTSNTVTSTQVGIYNDANGSTISLNHVTRTHNFYGILVPDDGNNITVTRNNITRTDGAAILADGQGAVITRNIINETPVGICYDNLNANPPTTGANANLFYNFTFALVTPTNNLLNCPPQFPAVTAAPAAAGGATVNVSPAR